MPSMINGRQTILGGQVVNTLFDLTDRVAVVSGAGGGLGTAVCEGLAAHGADLALIDIDVNALAASAAGVERAGRQALTLECDASSESAVEEVFARVEETFGRLDILINLAYTPTFGRAGGTLPGRLGEGAAHQFDRAISSAAGRPAGE